MLPYPSGKLHMGHVRNYTINDMLTRHLRMKGYNVLMPMGWDAFGLPAENAALKNGVPPAKWTYENIAYMKQANAGDGLGHRLVARSGHLRRHLLQMEPVVVFEDAGKRHRLPQNPVVNWDPVDQTVLANEQVVDGKVAGAPACGDRKTRDPRWYYVRITDYAQELLDYVQVGTSKRP